MRRDITSIKLYVLNYNFELRVKYIHDISSRYSNMYLKLDAYSIAHII